MSTATRWPASYERISKFKVDRDGVQAEITRGVGRQREDNTAVATTLGLGALQPYRDDGYSASQFATKERTEWVRLIADLRASKVSHVLVWLFDRAFRTTEACEELLAACRQGGALIVQTAGSPVVADPHNPDDIFRLKLAGLLAEYEIAKMSMRQRRAKLANAKAGKCHGGRRVFGYTSGMRGPVEAEAVAVRKVVAKVLAGSSLRSQAQWLNDQGLIGSRGAQWTGPNLGRFLQKPALAGVVLFTEDGEQQSVQAVWHTYAVLSVAQHEQIVGMLGDPARKRAGDNVRKHRLAGLMRCGHQGCTDALRSAPYRSRARADYGQVRHTYRCAAGHVQRPVELLEETVMATAAAYLMRLRPDGILRNPQQEVELAQLAVQATVLHDRIKRYRADYKAGEISAADRNEYVAECEAELAQLAGLKADLLQQHTVLADLAGRADARELLEALPWDRLRTVLSHLAVIHVDGGKGPFRPELVRFDWQVGA